MGNGSITREAARGREYGQTGSAAGSAKVPKPQA